MTQHPTDEDPDDYDVELEEPTIQDGESPSIEEIYNDAHSGLFPEFGPMPSQSQDS